MSDSGDQVSGAQAASTVRGDGDISENWQKTSWEADLAQALWRKSSWSACNGNCVEVAAFRPGLIGVRDSKEAGQGPVLVFDDVAWRTFIDSVKVGG